MDRLQPRVTGLKGHMRGISASASDVLILQLARVHNCTFLLDQFPKPPAQQTSTPTAGDTIGESDSTYSTQASAGTRFDRSTAQTPITITISDVPTAAIPASPSKAVPNRTVQDVVSQYHLDQKLLEKQLYACRHSMLVPADRFESLFNHDIYRKQCWCISLKNYPRVFEMIGRISVSETDTQIAETLRSVISGREEAQKFYQSLDASDEGHQNMIDVLKAGEAVLLWKTRSLKASD